MLFNTPLIHGKLVKRYKRFLADIELENGEVVVAHCTNSGSMKSCIEVGADVCLSPVNDPKRKTKFTWEMIKINHKWVGINTGWPNVLAFNAIKNNEIPGLPQYNIVKREVKFDNSRFDVYAENDKEKCFVEVKNVTLKEGDGALFPDAVTTRGLKHLNTLVKVKKEGYRAIMLYIIQRSDVSYFGPATSIDPDYAEGLKNATQNGVEIVAMQAEVAPEGIQLMNSLPVKLD